ncbi:MAG: ABC transporter permease subunit [Candidatus Bathyarchaeia archaeon]
MRLWKSWTVATKDLSVFRKNKYILYSLIALPFLLGLLIPTIILFSLQSQIPSTSQTSLLEASTIYINTASGYFVLVAAILPTIIASYSFVGEKIEKSLEPLLATPTTDGELLFGKSLAAFLPCIGATYVGGAIFVTLVDVWSFINFRSFLLPNPYWAVITGIVTPLACILSVEANVIISSRVNDVRAAQQLGGLVILPLILVVILASTNSAIPNSSLALIVSGALAAADLALFYLSKATFQREEILTKWK